MLLSLWVADMAQCRGTYRGVEHLQCGQRLSPFRKLPSSKVYGLVAMERQYQNYSSQNNGPEQSRDRIVEDEVAGLGA